MAIEHLDFGTGFAFDVNWGQAAGPALRQGDWEPIQKPTIIQNNPGGFSGTVGYMIIPRIEGREGLNVVIMPSEGVNRLPPDSPAILAANRIIREEAEHGAWYMRPRWLRSGRAIVYPLLDVPLRNVTDPAPARYLTGILRFMLQ